jgi:hypothetical protein
MDPLFSVSKYRNIWKKEKISFKFKIINSTKRSLIHTGCPIFSSYISTSIVTVTLLHILGKMFFLKSLD